MKVIELIEILKKVPQDSTIGTFDTEDNSIFDYVCVYGKKDKVFTCHGETNISDIEKARYSNESKLCNYYIG